MANSEKPDATMTELGALGSYGSYIGAAMAVYGKYEELFGPATQVIDWNKFIIAAEKRIIAAAAQQSINDNLVKLQAVVKWWTPNCVEFLKKHPVSPGNLSKFETQIRPDTLDAHISTLENVIVYFAPGGKTPHTYGTYCALVTAYTLMYTLLTLKETYYIAKTGGKTGLSTVSYKVGEGIQAIKAWPQKYIAERSTHLEVEIETKRQGHSVMGEPRTKTFTGWYILHDSVDDPAVRSFEGQRFLRQFPDKPKKVAEAFAKSELSTTVIPKLLAAWNDLHTKARVAEATPLKLVDTAGTPRITTSTISSTTTTLTAIPKRVDPFTFFKSNVWYCLRSYAPAKLAIEVASGSSAPSSDARLVLVPESHEPGQLWQLRHSSFSPGSWNLCTFVLGVSKCLDVYGDDKTRPHLASAGNFSGQQWQLIDGMDGTWRLTNLYSGPDLFLDVGMTSGGSAELTLKGRGDGATQRWVPVTVRQITEPGF